MQKGFVPVLIVILIAALVGGYFVYSNFQTKTPTSTIQPSPSPADETANPDSIGANWKTYTNKGIYFEYPSDWNISPYTDNTIIISSSPNIKLVVVPKDGTLMNECMQEVSEEIKNGLTIRKFTRVTTGAMCSTTDSNPREIWVVPSKGAYSPGINYQYSAAEDKQAEEIFNQILSTFKFTN